MSGTLNKKSYVNPVSVSSVHECSALREYNGRLILGADRLSCGMCIT